MTHTNRRAPARHLPATVTAGPRRLAWSVLFVLAASFFPATACGDYIYVANSGTDTVGLYTTSGAAVNPNLITGLVRVYSLAVSDGFLYVSTFGSTPTGGTIGKYTLLGEPVNPSLITGLTQPSSIAVSGTDLYVANAGTASVGKYTTSGATINASFISLTQGTAQSVAVSGSSVYVASSGTYRIGEYSASSGAPINDHLINGPTGGYSLAISGPDLYVMHSMSSNGYVSKHTLSGTLVDASLVSGLNNPFGLAVSGSDLYVSSFYPSSIVGAYTTSGAVVNPSFISGLNRPYGIAVTANIPEPSGLVLLTTAATAILWRCGRRRFSSPASICIAMRRSDQP